MDRRAEHPERCGRRARGFSLLELMLVLVIIGVLAALAAWNVVGTGAKAKIRATKASMGVIQSMLKAYYLDHNTYPPDMATLVTAKYLELNKDKDGFNRAFHYKPTTNPEKPFELISAGEDGQFGTNDDIDAWNPDKTQ